MRDIALREPRLRSKELQDKLAHYVGNAPAARLVDLLKDIRLSIYRLQCALRFQLHAWGPKRGLATYLGYYPDGLPSTPALRELYRKWIRGNRTNNNGDAARFISLVLNIRQLLEEGVDGDFAELGVWKGNSAALLAYFASGSNRRLFLFDTFSGFDQRDMVGLDESKPLEFADTSLEYVQETVGQSGVTTYLKGYFPDTITDEVRQTKFAIAHVDCDLYEPMKAALDFFYARMPRGAMLILHDYSSGAWSGAKAAVDEFCQATGEFVSLWPDKSGTAVIRKSC
jgi:Macrocin-O-methyltransferase (TylF)